MKINFPCWKIDFHDVKYETLLNRGINRVRIMSDKNFYSLFLFLFNCRMETSIRGAKKKIDRN